jgi:hypothetical protein
MTKTAVKENTEAPLFGEVEAPAKAPAKAEKAAKKTEVAVVSERKLAKAPTTDPTGMIAMIREVAMNPDVDVEKMQAILSMQERILDRTAKMEFDAALADMQIDLPTVDQKGKIEIKAKDASGERKGPVQQSTKFAKFEDINEAIRPIISKYGFAVSFRTGLTEDGRVKIIGILSHRAGHREETMMVLPHDATGSKNAVQAIGSSTSYGKRYILCALLNLTSRGEDDDGKQGGGEAIEDGEAKITGEQESKLIDAIEDCKIGRPKFCTHYKIDMVAQLPARLFDEAVKACADYKAKREKR